MNNGPQYHVILHVTRLVYFSIDTLFEIIICGIFNVVLTRFVSFSMNTLFELIICVILNELILPSILHYFGSYKIFIIMIVELH